MSNEPVSHHRQRVLAGKVLNLFSSLDPSTYNEIAPKVEYWIEYALTAQFMPTEDLVERISPVAWGGGSQSHISRFLKGFRDAPHRSERMRSFVDQLCIYVLQWFAVASADSLWVDDSWKRIRVPSNEGHNLVRAASFAGHLIECGLLSRELVRWNLVKPLTSHHSGNIVEQAIWANAIYQLFTAGNALLQGFLEPEDVQICFERLETRITLGQISGLGLLDAVRVNVWV
jgi:hypothetical protein